MSKKKKKARRVQAEEKTKVTLPKLKKEKEPRETLCNACCSLLMERKYTTLEIEAILNEKFPNMNGTPLVINYYRSRINTGKLESIGFPAPEEKLVPIKKEEDAIEDDEEDTEEKKVKPGTKKKPTKPAKKKITKKK